MLLFLANYPAPENIHEGMSQRIVAMDRQFERANRTYLFVSHRLFREKEVQDIGEGVIQYRCNLFIHFFFILRLIRSSDTLFFHSVITALPLLPLWPFIRKCTRLILDAHGTVPEEIRLSGIRWKARLYGISERLLFGRADVVIAVTHAMVRHFQSKYPSASPRYVRYAILPAHLADTDTHKGHITDVDTVRVIYSGNLQSWQHIDLMLETIKCNFSQKITYELLTGEPDRMRQLLAKHGLPTDGNLRVLTVDPRELGDYYRQAHYGFILRDDITINRVACPTKMVEYLFHGMIPVVKSPWIGDFAEMGYEYISYENFSDDLPPMKSEVNRRLVHDMITENSRLNLLDLLNGDA